MLAPMAGITDMPFRHAVHQFGVGMTCAEMISSQPQLIHSRKSQQRRISLDEPLPRAIQIVGNEPKHMANAAKYNVKLGAGLIDINMGCPAKKVYRKAAGSALLADESCVKAILEAVVDAVDVPVTLKIRTGISRDKNNAVTIAMIAQDAGIAALSVHGRSKQCMFKGEAEHQTVMNVKAAVSLPVIVNGDIQTPQQAYDVYRQTGADGIMVGRATQGQPWLISMMTKFIAAQNNQHKQAALQSPTIEHQMHACLEHINNIYAYYGEIQGVRIARKHIRWYLSFFQYGDQTAKKINLIDAPKQVLQMIETFYLQQMHQDIAA